MKVNKLFSEYLKDKETDVVIQIGGGGSGKSFFALEQWLVLIIITEEKKKVMSLRKNGADVANSILLNVLNGLDSIGLVLDQDYSFNKTSKTITLLTNFGDKQTAGNTILFKGLDDNKKIKSYVGITDIFLEELTEFTLDDWLELKARVRDVDGSKQTKKRIVGMMNPEDEYFWTYNEFEFMGDKRNVDIYQRFDENDNLEMLRNKPKKWYFETHEEVEGQTVVTKHKVCRSNFEDNPFLDMKTKANIESYRKTDYNRYIRYRAGLSVPRDEQVFKNFEVKVLDEDIFEEDWKHGMDFGFSSDPTACIKLIKDEKLKVLYIRSELIYHTDLTNADIYDKLKDYDIPMVTADSAEPKSIEELKRLGLKIKPVEKGAGSINEGIKKMKEYKIVIHPSCVNVIKEFKSYKYKTDKSGKILPTMIDADNHAIDAIRYALREKKKSKAYV